MGRKAKLKKQRHQLRNNKSDVAASQPQNFIKQMNQEGYRLEKIQQSPDIPQENIEPQV